MESKIISQDKNPFLEREEFVIEIKNSEGVPTKDDVIEDLGKKKELTVIRKINTNFGREEFTADVIVYDSVEAKEKYQIIPQKIKKKMEEERKAKEAEEKKKKEEEEKAAEDAKAAAKEAKKAEEKSEEAPSDEGKEEIKEETPKEEKTAEEGK